MVTVMTLLTVKEAAAFLRYKNHRSLYNNKTVPRRSLGGRVLFVMEELEQWISSELKPPADSAVDSGRPMFRIKVRA